MADTPVQRFYRYHALVYDKTRWAILHGRRRAVERMQLQPHSSVLEVGCGTGLNFHYVLDYLDSAKGRLVGLDFSEDMLRCALRRVEDRGWSHVACVQGDATTMHFDESFDGILFAYSLTMIPDWRAALDRAYALLRPGGRLAVLDFSTFDGWGPLAPLIRAWFRWHHVETAQPYQEKLREMFPDLEVLRWLGGYNFTAVGRKAHVPGD